MGDGVRKETIQVLSEQLTGFAQCAPFKWHSGA
jgi:hypothetical protein